LPLPAECNILILGAGIMGCSLAYWLARHGAVPFVLERNSHPAGGATGRNGGLVVGGPGGHYHSAIESLGHEAAREIVHATNLNRALLEELLEREAIDAAYRRTGLLTLGLGDEAAALKQSARALVEDDFAAEWLDRAEAEKALGTRLGPGCEGALLNPNEATIHSAGYTFGVAAAAARRGAQFNYSTPVLGVERAPGGHGWLVRTPHGDVTAGQVVIALNAWAGDLLPELSRLITQVRGHIILTAPVDSRVMPWSANYGFEYGRQLEDGRLLVGGKRECREDLDLNYPPLPGENVPAVEPAVVEALTEFVPAIFPELAGLPTVHHWTGMMDFSPDGHPLVGQWPGREGLWLMVGFTGHGMPYSQVLPCALAAQIANADGPPMPSAFNPTRLLTQPE
jgi:glycine/D-amino acid oxidase-like deaminating enzyme